MELVPMSMAAIRTLASHAASLHFTSIVGRTRHGQVKLARPPALHAAPDRDGLVADVARAIGRRERSALARVFSLLARVGQSRASRGSQAPTWRAGHDFLVNATPVAAGERPQLLEISSSLAGHGPC